MEFLIVGWIYIAIASLMALVLEKTLKFFLMPKKVQTSMQDALKFGQKYKA